MTAGRESVVVVGVDGSPASVDALVHGFGEADARGGWVEVVTAWSWPSASADVTELGRAHEGRRHALADPGRGRRQGTAALPRPLPGSPRCSSRATPRPCWPTPGAAPPAS